MTHQTRRLTPRPPQSVPVGGCKLESLNVDQLSESREDFDRIAAEILIVSIDLGLTFAQIATDQLRDPEAKARTVRKARRAYDEVLRRRLSFRMESSQTENLEDKLLSLKNRLLVLGETFD